MCVWTLLVRCVRGCSVVGVLLLLYGCVTYTPQPLDPFEEFEKLERRTTELHDLTVVSPGRQEWFPLQGNIDLSDGIDLAEAHALALVYAPEIRAARRTERVVGAQLLQAGLLSNPEVFVGPRLSMQDGTAILPVGLSWELPLWGKPRAEKDRAQGKLKAAEIRVLETELRVLTGIRSTFIQAARHSKSQEAYEAELRNSERLVEWVSALEQVGEVDAVTAYLARLALDEARDVLETTRLELQTTTRSLLETVGVLPSAELSLVLGPEAFQLPALPPLSRERLLFHPEVRSAHAQYEAAEAALRLEIAKQYPTIGAGPSFEDDDGDSSLGLGVGVELPFFDRNRGGVLEAEERRDAARERVQTVLLRLSHAEAQARAEWNATQSLLESYRAGALADVERVRVSLDRHYRTGQTHALEVLTTLSALAKARGRELELESASATARLRAAVAGGAVWNDPADMGSNEDGR